MTEISGWGIYTSDDGKYLYVTLDGKPGSIAIKAEDEGFVVDIWAKDGFESAASTYASYTELELEEQP